MSFFFSIKETGKEPIVLNTSYFSEILLFMCATPL